jgi:hypothetical protein
MAVTTSKEHHMVNRKRKRRIALVALLAFVLGTTAFAYAATITFNGGSAGNAGQGTGQISGYVVSNVHYTLDDVDPSSITSVTFSLTPDNATTVKAKIQGAPDWALCSETGTTWSCGVTGDAEGATNLEVAAAS